jgi:protein AroM
MKKIGVVIIGQSQKPQVTDELKRILGKGYELVEYGALDDYSLEDVKEKIKIRPNEGILVTSMRDGTEVKITHDFVTPLVHKGVQELEKKGVDIILLLCTGKFPGLKSKHLVITPNEIVAASRDAALREGKLGMVFPGKEQVRVPYEKHGNLEVFYDSASPYAPIKGVEEMAHRMAERDVDLIILNCMGFNQEMKELVKKITKKPVVQSSSLVARILQEYLE